MRRRPYEALPPVEYARLLAVLREDRFLEYPLKGWDAIGDFFVKMKLAYRRPRPETLRKYVARWQMPVWPARIYNDPSIRSSNKRVPFTTNILLNAWMASQGRAMHLPRWHPFRQALERQYSQKPSAVRMRRTRERRLRAEALAGNPSCGDDTSRRSPGISPAAGSDRPLAAPADAGPIGSGPPSARR